MDAAYKLRGVASVLEYVAGNCDRIADGNNGQTGECATAASVVIRNLVSALDAANAGRPAALEALAELTTGELFDDALVSAMGGAA